MSSEILEIHNLLHGLTDYEVKINDDIAANIREEDLIPFKREENIEYSINNLSKYLNEKTMEDIVKQVYTKKITEYIDEIIAHRSRYSGMAVLDIVMKEIAKYYTDKYGPMYEGQFQKRCEEIINREYIDKSGEFTDFMQNISYRLEKVIGDYIDSHKDDIIPDARKIVNTAIKKITSDQISWKISKAININEIIKEILAEETNA